MVGVVKTDACYTIGRAMGRGRGPDAAPGRERGRAIGAPRGSDAARRRARPTMAATMRIAMIASECEPFAKTGGLADVVDALSRALGAASPRGSRARRRRLPAVVPGRRAARAPSTRSRVEVPARASAATEPVTIWTGSADGYRLRLVEHAPSFDRDGLYMADGRDHPDNAARFTLLGRAALEAMRAEGDPVDVVHGHDWEAGPALLALALELAPGRSRSAAGHRADLPQPRLPRLDASARTRGSSTCPTRSATPGASTSCARRSASPTS